MNRSKSFASIATESGLDMGAVDNNVAVENVAADQELAEQLEVGITWFILIGSGLIIVSLKSAPITPMLHLIVARL